MPEAGLNCIVCLRKETKTPQCPASLIRAGRLEEGPGDSTATAEAKLLAHTLPDAAERRCATTNGTRASFPILPLRDHTALLPAAH